MTTSNSDKLFGCVFCEYSSPNKGSVKYHVFRSCKYKYTNTNDKNNPKFFRMVDKKEVKTEDNNEVKIEDINVNDKNIHDFIESKNVKVDGIIIGKNRLFDEYKNMFPDCQFNIREFIVHVKKEGIMYTPYVRYDGNEGCFGNIKSNNIQTNYKQMNDKNIHDFLESKIIKIDGIRIGKNRLFDEYKKIFPDCQINTREFIVHIKKEGIMYTPYVRCDGNEGCFLNIQFNDVIE